MDCSLACLDSLSPSFDSASPLSCSQTLSETGRSFYTLDDDASCIVQARTGLDIETSAVSEARRAASLQSAAQRHMLFAMAINPALVGEFVLICTILRVNTVRNGAVPTMACSRKPQSLCA